MLDKIDGNWAQALPRTPPNVRMPSRGMAQRGEHLKLCFTNSRGALPTVFEMLTAALKQSYESVEGT